MPLGIARVVASDWHGVSNYVDLDPHVTPAHVFAIGRTSRSESDYEHFA